MNDDRQHHLSLSIIMSFSEPPRKIQPKFSHPPQFPCRTIPLSLSSFSTNAPNRQCNSTHLRAFDGAFVHVICFSPPPLLKTCDTEARRARMVPLRTGHVWRPFEAEFGCMGGVRGIGQTLVAYANGLGGGNGAARWAQQRFLGSFACASRELFRPVSRFC